MFVTDQKKVLIFLTSGPADFRGLLLYLSLARSLMKAEMDESIVVKMLRWQQLSGEASLQ